MIKTPLSTVIGGAFWTPGATVINGKEIFSVFVKSLFANGEQGFFYDPNDLSTMYQDAAGTVPVTAVGQAVGLMLDKSKELVLGGINYWNGTPDTLAPNWVNNGDGTFTSNGGSGVFGVLISGMNIGRFYEWVFEITSHTSGAVRPQNQSGAGYAYAGSTGLFTQKALCNNTALYFYSNGFSGTIRPIAVREIFGNHAYQTTSAARPILQDAPRRIDFDAVDDKLITNLPAQVTVCTVIRSVPGVGVQLFTNQTIPATYEDNKDHCGLIVINRALTPSETSAIAAEFNKRAGV